MFAIRAPLTPKTIPFWDEFVKRFGTAPVYTGIGAYDAVYVYADAVKRANSIEPDAVIKELEKTGPCRHRRQAACSTKSTT